MFEVYVKNMTKERREGGPAWVWGSDESGATKELKNTCPRLLEHKKILNITWTYLFGRSHEQTEVD